MVPQTPKFPLETVKTPVRRVFPAGRPYYLEHSWNKDLNAQEVSFARVPDRWKNACPGGSMACHRNSPNNPSALGSSEIAMREVSAWGCEERVHGHSIQNKA